MEFTEEQIKTIMVAAGGIDLALQRHLRYDEELELTAGAGDNTFDGGRVAVARILVITHMSAYNAVSACTYLRLGYWNRTRYVWIRIVPAPLVLETVEFNGELGLQEGMWPAIQWNGATANDDLHGLVSGYWIRIPRIS